MNVSAVRDTNEAEGSALIPRSRSRGILNKQLLVQSESAGVFSYGGKVVSFQIHMQAESEFVGTQTTRQPCWHHKNVVFLVAFLGFWKQAAKIYLHFGQASFKYCDKKNNLRFLPSERELSLRWDWSEKEKTLATQTHQDLFGCSAGIDTITHDW